MSQAFERNQPWWQLLAIQAGGTICLPVILVGQLVCQKFGWGAALLGLGIGNAFLLIVGYCLATLSAKRPQSTVEHAASYFGNPGRILFAGLMTLTTLGWFGIQLNVMSLSVHQLLEMAGISVSAIFINILIGTVLSCVMCYGMRAMKYLSNFTAPALALTLLYAIFSAKGEIPAGKILSSNWLASVSLIIGANIAAVIDIPTFFRHAKSKKDARICTLLLYGLVVPFIEGVGIYLAAVTRGNSFLEVLQSGHGIAWVVWISIFVLLSGWGTNNANLYSTITSSYSFKGDLKPVLRTLYLGAIGTLIACFNPLGNIESVLDILSVTISAMGAVILSSYVFEIRNPNYEKRIWVSILSWSIGVGLGLLTSITGIFLTGIPAFDAFIAVCLSQLGLNVIFQRKESYEKNNS